MDPALAIHGVPSFAAFGRHAWESEESGTSFLRGCSIQSEDRYNTLDDFSSLYPRLSNERSMLPSCNRQPTGVGTSPDYEVVRNHRGNRKRIRFLALLLGSVGLLPYWHTAPRAWAEEPAAKFLQGLKDAGYYDEALKYLEISSARNRLPESMKGDIGLEKVMLLQLSLAEVRTSKDLDEKLGQVELGFKEFLTKSPEHPRRGETLLKLADLYLNRGTKYLDDSKEALGKPETEAKAKELREKARPSFQQAFDTFSTTLETLRPTLEQLQGANVKPSETERLALREKLQKEYRQAQILQAITSKLIAETFEPNTPEWKQRLEEADKKLYDVAEKSTGAKYAGSKYLSLLNRGRVQALLGQIDGARETFKRVAENDEAGIFRTWRIQAIAEMVRLDSTPASGKYEAAVMAGEEQLKQADFREREKPEWQELALAVAEARIAWTKALDPKADDGKIRNIRREARETFQTLAKKNSPVANRARDYLKDLGIEAKANDDTKLPEVKNFTEAMKAARSRLDRAEEGEGTIKLLEKQLAGAPESERKAIEDQVRLVESDSKRDREQAIELNDMALRLYRDDDSREDLAQIRFLQAYLHLRLQNYWECLAISEVLLRTGKGTETGQKAGSFALMSLGQIIESSPAESQAALISSLERLANDLNESAPGSSEGEQAVDILVSLALREKQYDKAEEYLKSKKTAGGDKAFLLGRILWAEYRKAIYVHRQAKTEPTAADEALRQRAEKLLSDAWNNLSLESSATGVLEGSNDLVGLYLQSGRLEEAMKVLNEPGKGAIAVMKGSPDAPLSAQLDTYRLNLQAMVQSAGQGRSDLSAEQIDEAIRTMKGLCDKAGDTTMLPKSLQNLAAELQNQMEVNKNPEQQAKLASCFKILIDQLTGVSSDPAVIESAGAAMIVLATNLEKVPALAARAPEMMATAEKAYTKLSTLSPEELEKIKRKPEEIMLKLGLAKRGAKKFDEANKLFIEALQKNQSNITVQIEAARNLQLSSGGKDIEKLKSAMLGAETLPNKKKLIWGWGQIAQVTARYPNFQKEFFEARLNIARCRGLIGDASSGAEKQKLYEAAIADISQTYSRFPELGTPETRNEFDRLLREMQQKASKPATGLAGLPKPPSEPTPEK